MADLPLFRIFAREWLSRRCVARVVEPDLVMDDPQKVAAFNEAGREDGVMAPVYLYHGAHICEVIAPGDTVLDLGCGPANQLAVVARLNPQTRFIGVDLSPEMLARARGHLAAQGLDNVELRAGDLTSLGEFADDSVDAVVSTVALHHLPDLAALARAFAEIGRVLRPGGGVYVVDFGRLKRDASMRDFAHQHTALKPELFTLDYLYSMRAAFTRRELEELTREHLEGRARVHATFGIPYKVAVKSAPRQREDSEQVSSALRARVAALPAPLRADLEGLRRFFNLGGMRCRLL